MKIIYKFYHRNIVVYSIFLIMICQSCSVRLISLYDATTDKTLTAMQEKTSKFFVDIKNVLDNTEEAKYEKFKTYYNEMKVSLNVLKVRTAALDKSELVLKQIEELSGQLDDLEKFHKTGFVSFAIIAEKENPLTISHNLMDNSFTSILKFQNALKRP
jgi:hypothetical protein